MKPARSTPASRNTRPGLAPAMGYNQIFDWCPGRAPDTRADTVSRP